MSGQIVLSSQDLDDLAVALRRITAVTAATGIRFDSYGPFEVGKLSWNLPVRVSYSTGLGYYVDERIGL